MTKATNSTEFLIDRAIYSDDFILFCRKKSVFWQELLRWLFAGQATNLLIKYWNYLFDNLSGLFTTIYRVFHFVCVLFVLLKLMPPVAHHHPVDNKFVFFTRCDKFMFLVACLTTSRFFFFVLLFSGVAHCLNVSFFFCLAWFNLSFMDCHSSSVLSTKRASNELVHTSSIAQI